MNTLSSGNLNHRRRWRFRLLLMAASLLVGSIFYLLFATNLFKIRSVSVLGSHLTDPDQIASLASINYLWSPVVFFSLPPEVKNITATKSYWRREVVLEVSERRQYALWCAANSCLWFDEEGIAFALSPRAHGSLIKVIDSESPATVGEPVLPRRLLNNFLSILNILQELELPVAKITVLALSKEELIIELSDSLLPIYFSLRLDPAFTRDAINSLRDDFDRLEYLDLRSANRAFYRYK